MSITFSTPNVNVTINESKLHQVLTASTSKEATKIINLSDFIDKITDWLKGGVKHKVIKDLFFAIQDIKNENKINPESNRLKKFMELRNLVHPEHQNKFTLEISEKDVNNDWGYKLKIDGSILYVCDKVFEKTKNFEEKMNFPTFHANKIRMKLEEKLFQLNNIKALGDLEYYKRFSACAMIDGKNNLTSLKEKFNDSSYSKENFLGIKEHNPGETFIACFKNGKELIFSDRISSNGELRGDNLKDLLKNEEYTSLDKLVESGYQTRHDRILKQRLGTIKLNYYDPIANDEQLSKKELENLHNELKLMKIDNTNLFEIWDIDIDNIIKHTEFFDDDYQPEINPYNYLIDDPLYPKTLFSHEEQRDIENINILYSQLDDNLSFKNDKFEPHFYKIA